MTFEIKDYFETPVILEPRVELYTVYDFMGQELPGLAIVLDMPIQGADEKEQFAILTKSFGEFIGLKNSAYVDMNNCPFAPQLLPKVFISAILTADHPAHLDLMAKKALIIVLDVPPGSAVSAIDLLCHHDFLIFPSAGVKNNKGKLPVGFHVPFLQISRF